MCPAMSSTTSSRRRRRFVVGAAAALWVLAWPRIGVACTCSEADLDPSVPCVHFWRDDVVFVGEVLRIDRQHDREIVTIEVGEIFRGLNAATVTLTGLATSCSYPFEKGERYMVHATRLPDGQLSATKCSGTRRLAAATEE